MKKIPAKRVNVVSVALVKESSLLYETRFIRSSMNLRDFAYELIGEKDREHLLVIGLTTKNEPTMINTAHIGSINTSIAHPREIFKPLILSNSAKFAIVHNHPSSDVINIVS